MKKIRQAWYAAPVSWLLLATLVGGPMVLTAPPAAAQAATPTESVAVVQVVNQSGSSVQNLASRAASALSTQLASSGRFKVIGSAMVDRALDRAGVQLPLRPDMRERQLEAIAGALHADYLITAQIASVEVDTAKQLAAVGSTLSVYGRVAKGDLTVVETTAFNLSRASNEAVLIDDALEQNALYAVKGLVTNLGIRGKVLAPPLETAVRITLKESEYLRKGAQFSVLRNGLKIATLQLMAVHRGEGEGRIIRQERPEYHLGVDDELVLYKQGEKGLTADDPDWDPGKDVATPAEKTNKSTVTMLAAVAGVVLLGAGIWALVANKRDREDSRTPRLVTPVDGAVVRVTSSNAPEVAVNFTATTVLSSSQLVFEIASDPNFRTIVYTDVKEGSAGAAGTGGGTGTGGDTGTTIITEPGNTVLFTVDTEVTVLRPGTYFWRVTSISNRDTFYSNTFSFSAVRTDGSTSATSLRSPDVVNALPGNGQVELQWSPVANAAGYQVWRKINLPRFLDSRRTSRTFRPEGGFSAWMRGNGRRTPGVDRGNRRDVAGRVVGRQVGTDSLVGFSKVGETTSTATSFTDSTVSNGVDYQWVVLTVDSSSIATPLADAQAGSFVFATPLSTTPPATPTNFAAVAGDGQVTLTWSSNTEADLAGYQVYRSTAQSGNFDLAANLVTDGGSPTASSSGGVPLSAGVGDLSVRDTGLTNGVTVFYKVRAVQRSASHNLQNQGGLVSPLSDVQSATPSSAPPQELQVVQPAQGSTVDADRPLLSWRGVEGASEYTVQISTSSAFTTGLISFKSTSTEVIYPADQPALTQGTTYFIRVGVFDTTTQALRFGPTTSFTRGPALRFTTTVTASASGGPQPGPVQGARISIDGADTGELTPAQFILSPKANNAAYQITAVADLPDHTRLSGTVAYRPGIDAAAVDIAMAVLGIAPAAPTGLLATGQTDRIVLRWNPVPAGGVPVANYSIRRRSNTEEGPFTEIAQVQAPGQTASELFHTDFNVRSGTRYYYHIVAISGGIESIPSVTANAVAGVGVIQVVVPQDNQIFGVDFNGNTAWTSVINFAWIKVPDAARYVLEVGTDAELNTLLSNGNKIIPQSDSPSSTLTFSAQVDADHIFVSDGMEDLRTFYWRVIALDETNRIINQTEARRFRRATPAVAVKPTT